MDRLETAEALATKRHDARPVAVWGPDGGDLFEQMSRPVNSRLADLLRPVHAELHHLRARVDAAGRQHRSNAEGVPGIGQVCCGLAARTGGTLATEGCPCSCVCMLRCK